MYIFIYTYTYVCMYVYIYIYIYTYTLYYNTFPEIIPGKKLATSREHGLQVQRRSSRAPTKYVVLLETAAASIYIYIYIYIHIHIYDTTRYKKMITIMILSIITMVSIIATGKRVTAL